MTELNQAVRAPSGELSHPSTASAPDPLVAAFVSPEAKRALTWRAAVLALGLGGLQLLAPAAVVFWMMADMFLGMARSGDVQSLAASDTRLWWVDHPLSDRRQHHLRVQAVPSDPRGSPGEPREVAALPRDDYLLAPAEGGLWLVRDDDVRYYGDGPLQQLSPTRALTVYSSPHRINGQPAVLDFKYQDAVAIQSLTRGKWTEIGTIDFDRAPTVEPDVLLAVAAGGGRYHFFCRYGERFHYLAAAIGDKVKNPEDWPLIARVRALDWDVAAMQGRPVLVTLEPGVPYPRIVARRLDGSQWNEVLAATLTMATRVAADTGSRGRLLVSVAGPFGVRELWRVGSSGSVEHLTLGSSPLWSDPVGMVRITLPFYLLPALALPAAWLLGRWLRRYRALDRPLDEAGHRHASLLRRGLARGVDFGILVLPGALVLGLLAAGVFESDDLFVSPWFVAASLASFVLWYPPVLLGSAWLEGRWGKTPGKWLLGIRTAGIDLKPCGFWRGLLRNILLFADTFGNFAVGLLFIAFTQRLQRAGDIVANTIVVRDA